MKPFVQCLLILVTVLAGISSPPAAFAQKSKKPGGDGGGGGETPVGSIYYYHGTIFDVVQMEADGTGKTPLNIGSGVTNPSTNAGRDHVDLTPDYKNNF